MAKKYIDADLLRKEIDHRIDILEDMSIKCAKNDDAEMHAYYHGKAVSLQELLSFINSLQQEEKSVAERFARIVRGNLIGIDKEVQQKFEQLYFEVTGNKMYGGYND